MLSNRQFQLSKLSLILSAIWLFCHSATASSPGKLEIVEGHHDFRNLPKLHVFPNRYAPNGTEALDLEMTSSRLFAHVTLGDFPIHWPERIREIHFSPDGKFLDVIDANEDQIARYDWIQKKHLTTVGSFRKENQMRDLKISPDGKLIAGIHSGYTIKIFDRDTLKETQQIKLDQRTRMRRWASDSQSLLLTAEGKIKFLNIETGNISREIKHSPNQIDRMTMSKSGRMIATIGRNIRRKEPLPILVYNLENDAPPVKIVGKTKWRATSLCFSPDEKILTARMEANTNSFGAYSTETGKPIWTTRLPHCNRSVFSPNGKLVATGGLQHLTIFDAQTGEKIFRCRDMGVNRHVYAIGFTTDGKVLAASIEDQVRFWRVKDWSEINPSKHHHTPVTSLVFNKDGTRLLSGSVGGRLILWDWKTKEVLWKNDYPEKNPEERNWGIRHLALNHDDSLIGATIPPLNPRKGHSSHLISIADGSVQKSFGDPDWPHSQILFSRDSSKIYISGKEGKLQEWDYPSTRLAREFGTWDKELFPYSPPSLEFLELPMIGEEGIWWTDNKRQLFLRDVETGKDSQMDSEIPIQRSGGLKTTGSLALLNHAKGLRNGLRKSFPITRSIPESFREVLPAHHLHPFGRLYLKIAKERNHGDYLLIDSLTNETLATIPKRGDFLTVSFSPDGELIVLGGTHGIHHLSLAQIFRHHHLPNLTEEELWKVMGRADSLLAWKATWELSRRENATSFISQKLKPETGMTKESESLFREMVRDENFEIRIAAGRALIDAGKTLSKQEADSMYRLEWDFPNHSELASKTIKSPLPRSPIQRSFLGYCSKPAALNPLSNRARSSRGVFLLEKSGTLEAKECLEALLEGAPEHPQTQEAKLAYLRMHHLN